MMMVYQPMAIAIFHPIQQGDRLQHITLTTSCNLDRKANGRLRLFSTHTVFSLPQLYLVR